MPLALQIALEFSEDTFVCQTLDDAKHNTLLISMYLAQTAHRPIKDVEHGLNESLPELSQVLCCSVGRNADSASNQIVTRGYLGPFCWSMLTWTQHAATAQGNSGFAIAFTSFLWHVIISTDGGIGLYLCTEIVDCTNLAGITWWAYE